jgi:hypothetical protein
MASDWHCISDEVVDRSFEFLDGTEDATLEASLGHDIRSNTPFTALARMPKLE